MTTWYLARGAGLAALILLSATAAIGALMTRRARSDRRVVASYLHRVTASLGLAALALHLTTILADAYAHVGWLGALVPFTSAYRPQWVALGTLAIYTFCLVAVLGFARARFASSGRGVRTWRALHCLAYAGWAMAMLHGLESGTDSSVGWVRLLYVACAVAVLSAVAVRLAPRTREWRITHRVVGYSPLLDAKVTTREKAVAAR